jgi:hypothetical protein
MQFTTPRHVIPDSSPPRESACYSVYDQSDIGDNQCMMIKLTGKRCGHKSPEYSLISQKNPQIIYHICGNCVSKKASWWKYAYERADKKY